MEYFVNDSRSVYKEKQKTKISQWFKVCLQEKKEKDSSMIQRVSTKKKENKDSSIIQGVSTKRPAQWLKLDVLASLMRTISK